MYRRPDLPAMYPGDDAAAGVGGGDEGRRKRRRWLNDGSPDRTGCPAVASGSQGVMATWLACSASSCSCSASYFPRQWRGYSCRSPVCARRSRSLPPRAQTRRTLARPLVGARGHRQADRVDPAIPIGTEGDADPAQWGAIAICGCTTGDVTTRLDDIRKTNFVRWFTGIVCTSCSVKTWWRDFSCSRSSFVSSYLVPGSHRVAAVPGSPPVLLLCAEHRVGRRRSARKR